MAASFCFCDSNFLGVPPEYKHLITKDADRSGSSTSVVKKFTYAE